MTYDGQYTAVSVGQVRLTDSSIAYDIIISQGELDVRFALTARTMVEAQAIAATLVKWISENTVEAVRGI